MAWLWFLTVWVELINGYIFLIVWSGDFIHLFSSPISKHYVHPEMPELHQMLWTEHSKTEPLFLSHFYCIIV